MRVIKAGCLVVLIVVVAIAWSAWQTASRLPALSSRTSPQSTITEPTPTEPAPTAPVETSLEDQLAAAKIQTAAASSVLQAAREKCIQNLATSPEYAQRSALAEQKKSVYRSLQASGTIQQKLDAGSAWHVVQAEVEKSEANAVAGDASVAAAVASHRAAASKETAISAQIHARLVANAKDAEERKTIEADRIYNDPINVAIREHRLVEGMSYHQAVEAIGRPYSVSKSGTFIMATWQPFANDYWSASLSNDEIISTSHTRL